MWFIFMNSIKDLIHLPDIPCELLGDCVDNSRIIQLIGRKGYNIVAQLYALLLSKRPSVKSCVSEIRQSQVWSSENRVE